MEAISVEPSESVGASRAVKRARHERNGSAASTRSRPPALPNAPPPTSLARDSRRYQAGKRAREGDHSDLSDSFDNDGSLSPSHPPLSRYHRDRHDLHRRSYSDKSSYLRSYRPERGYSRRSDVRDRRSDRHFHRRREYKRRHVSNREVDEQYASSHTSDGHYKYRLGDSIGSEIVDEQDHSPSRRSSHSSRSSSHHHHHHHHHQSPRRRYKLIAVVGEGTFGRVFSCWDRVKLHYVAVKVVKAIERYSEAAQIEIDILEKVTLHNDQEEVRQAQAHITAPSLSSQSSSLSSSLTTSSLPSISGRTNGEAELEGVKEIEMSDSESMSEPVSPLVAKEGVGPTNAPPAPYRSYCVQLLDWFVFRNHVCMVFPHHGHSVYDEMKLQNYRPFHIAVIKSVAHDVLCALYALHNKLELVHTDLKPENILFDTDSKEPLKKIPQIPTVPPGRPNAKVVDENEDEPTPDIPTARVIDFGNAVWTKKTHTSVICTRPYRPPEVLLRLPWSKPADVWALGCLLLEMYLGHIYFDTHHNVEHLAQIEKAFGPIPTHMLLDRDGFARNSQIEKYYQTHSSSLGDITCSLDFPLPSTADTAASIVASFLPLSSVIKPRHANFLDFISKLLRVDPSDRVSVAEALDHPFVRI